METKLVKFSKHYYLVETWNSSKMKFETEGAVDTLKEAHEHAEYLKIHREMPCSDIRITRQQTYDLYDKNSTEYEKQHNSLCDELYAIIDLLEEIKERGYIAWTSPAPSSSECKVKRLVDESIDNIYIATLYC